jgi:hypothetical protein
MTKLQTVLQAADMLGITSLTRAAVQHAARCGVTVEAHSSDSSTLQYSTGIISDSDSDSDTDTGSSAMPAVDGASS